MLVLQRRIGETIMVGDDTTVTVLSITGGQVKLGVTAPNSKRVDREEVRRRIEAGIEHKPKAVREDG